MSATKQNAIPYTKERCLKAAIYELVDDHEALKREVVELREHNKYLESRVSEESDYAAILTRHNELVEAVVWERECEEMHEDKCVMYLNTWWEYEVWRSLKAARAEVDRLNASDDCKGEG